MGYNTSFSGKLELNSKDLPVIATLEKILETDNFILKENHINRSDLCMNHMNELVWNGNEKTYNLDTQIRFIIREMLEYFPDFKLNGEFNAWGEEYRDSYKINVKDNVVLVIKPENEDYLLKEIIKNKVTAVNKLEDKVTIIMRPSENHLYSTELLTLIQNYIK